MQDKYLLAITGIVCIAIMESCAILTGTDGAYLSMCVGAVAGIIGAVVGVSVSFSKKQ